MIEVLPYINFSYYEDEKSDKFFKRNKIKTIIHLSKVQKMFKSSNFEEIVIDLDYDVNHFDEQKINIRLYEYLYDIIEFIYKKAIIENSSICILGFKNKQDIDIDRFHIKDVTVDEGQDLSTDCERRAGEIIREANFTDVKSLITISDFNVYCKKDGKVGVYGNKATFYNNRDEFNEEFNEEFDRIEVLYSFGISTYYIKGKI